MTTQAYRPPIVRPEADAPMPMWPVTMMIAWLPLWFLLGLAGFSWFVFAMPMAASLVRRRDLVVPKRHLLWIMFLVAVLGSVLSIDSPSRLAGWALRFGYYLAATVFFLYVLNGRSGVPVWGVVRCFTILWMATVVGGYLAFVLGDFGYLAPTGYVMPGVLLENELIKNMVSPSFADVQDVIGFPVPRPKAPFPYTNSWGSMLALTTPFAFISLREPRVGIPAKLVRLMLLAAVVPAVISLNRGLWLSLGVGLAYAALRFGVAGESRVLRNLILGSIFAVLLVTVTPLGDVVVTRIDTAHSNADRLELVEDAIVGTIERPVFGWGAPRPNDRNLPSVGTHGQIWFVMFSYGLVGAVGYFGTFINLAYLTRRQISDAGVWAHVVIIIGLAQVPYYLHVPQQMFTILGAAAIALRLQANPKVELL